MVPGLLVSFTVRLSTIANSSEDPNRKLVPFGTQRGEIQNPGATTIAILTDNQVWSLGPRSDRSVERLRDAPLSHVTKRHRQIRCDRAATCSALQSAAMDTAGSCLIRRRLIRSRFTAHLANRHGSRGFASDIRVPAKSGHRAIFREPVARQAR